MRECAASPNLLSDYKIFELGHGERGLHLSPLGPSERHIGPLNIVEVKMRTHWDR